MATDEISGAPVLSQNYEVTAAHRSGRSVIHWARRRSDGYPVVLKTSDDEPDPADVRSFFAARGRGAPRIHRLRARRVQAVRAGARPACAGGAVLRVRGPATGLEVR
jgi:hypothetical protein